MDRLADKRDVQALCMNEIAEARAPAADAARILIADDSVVSRRLLEAILRKWGYDVVAVSNGAEAWEILQSESSPRLAILDWMMPGLSGPEVCNLVRRNAGAHYTYIILLTSRHEKEDLIAGMESGADDYLVKPFDNNELKVRLGPGRRIIELQSELLAAQEALREQATRDSLTRLWNRHAIFEFLSNEISRSYREAVPLGVMICDIDHFKAINDTYGHMVGDAVLREVAARMKGGIRSYDAAGRYGGEEFLLILPGCDSDTALMTAERMREALRQSPIAIPEIPPLTVTASFGVTSLPKGRTTAPEQLVRLADDALYQAKQQGRNRSVFAPFA